MFRLTIDYNLSPEQMIAAGRYDWKNTEIEEGDFFQMDGEGIVEFEARYFHFDRDISSEDAVEEMKAAGWEPAKIEHLLSHGAKFPEEQRKYPIISLGSVSEIVGVCDVPYLEESDSGRSLDLTWFDDDRPLDKRYRFLAVRKVSAS